MVFRRFDQEGAIQHVMIRSNNGELLFGDNRDHYDFLEILRRTRTRFPFGLFAFCLMDTHIHLLTQTGSIKMGQFMQFLLSQYANRFNKKYERKGHLFHRPYKTILCETEMYLYTLVTYIHLNPVKAGLAKHPKDYLWSSYHCYSQNPTATHMPNMVDTHFILQSISPDETVARRTLLAYGE